MTVHQHTSSSTTVPAAAAVERPRRGPGRLRRIPLVVAGVVGCLLPTVWTLDSCGCWRRASSLTTASTS